MKRAPAQTRRCGAALLFASFTASCGPDRSPGGHEASVSSDAIARAESSSSAEPAREWFVRELVPSNLDTAQHGFGFSVAVSGSSAVVTAPGERAAYVFVRTSGGWHEQAKLEPPPGDEQLRGFGDSVAISDDTIVVGARSVFGPGAGPGAAYVYERSGERWSAAANLLAEDGRPNDENGKSDAFGHAVALDGDVAVVGAPAAADGSGAVYVFRRSDGGWLQAERRSATTDPGVARLGHSVAVSRDLVLAGAPWSYPQNAAFFFSGASEQRLVVPELDDLAEFGDSVALDGDLAVVGAHLWAGRNAPAGLRQGAAYVFETGTASLTEWTRAVSLFAPDGIDDDAFGKSVATSGGRIMVAAPGTGNFASAANTLYIFAPARGDTVQARIGGDDAPESFGAALALDGDIAIVGTTNGRGAYAAEFLVPRGGPCDEDLDCEDRHCVAGVCCDTACNGACDTCVSGVCKPDTESPDEPECAPYQCQEIDGDCPTSCRAHADCNETHFCLEGSCEPRQPNGASCVDSRDCASGRCNEGRCAGTLSNGERCERPSDCRSNFCVDGSCCDQLCDGQCEACDVRGARGICSPVEGAPHGERPACDGDGTSCDGSCDGEHTARCAYYGRDHECASSCEDGVQTRSFCDGAGQCEPDTPLSCGAYRCEDESRCRRECEHSGHCSDGFTCSDRGTCEAGSRCLDELTAERPDGSPELCWPYLCADGRCKTRCEDARRDCAPDAACRDHQCDEAPPRFVTQSSDGGCACRLERGGSARTPWPALFGVVLASARRRRTSRLRASASSQRPGPDRAP